MCSYSVCIYRLCGFKIREGSFNYPEAAPLVMNSSIIPVSFRTFDNPLTNRYPAARNGFELCYKLGKKYDISVFNTTTFVAQKQCLHVQVAKVKPF